MPTNRNTARSATEFEDMPRHDWPEHLRNLALAAGALYNAYVDLDYAARQIRASVESPEDAGPLMTLVGDAYRLLQAARFEGVSMLAAWESEQQLAAAEDDDGPNCSCTYPGTIGEVIVSPNGMVAVFCVHGQQLPNFQGLWKNRRQSIADSGYRGFVEFAGERMRHPEWLTFDVE